MLHLALHWLPTYLSVHAMILGRTGMHRLLHRRTDGYTSLSVSQCLCISASDNSESADGYLVSKAHAMLVTDAVISSSATEKMSHDAV